jgi:hypothetical protein
MVVGDMPGDADMPERLVERDDAARDDLHDGYLGRGADRMA